MVWLLGGLSVTVKIGTSYLDGMLSPRELKSKMNKIGVEFLCKSPVQEKHKVQNE